MYSKMVLTARHCGTPYINMTRSDDKKSAINRLLYICLEMFMNARHTHMYTRILQASPRSPNNCSTASMNDNIIIS